MDETTQLSLPLLQPSQAQKHVTVNEALMRLDAQVQLVVSSISTATPPAVVVDSVVYGVPNGAVNAWTGKDGMLAIGANGGWVFVAPKAGWRAWIAEEGHPAVHDGLTWKSGMATLSPSGAGTRVGMAEITHVISGGAVSSSTAIIPSHAMVLGVTARVTEAISGTLSSWQLGTSGAPDRFGSGLGISMGSWAKGILSQPFTYYSDTALELTATGGTFASGTVRLAAHYVELTVPSL